MQCWTATTRNEVTIKRKGKRRKVYRRDDSIEPKYKMCLLTTPSEHQLLRVTKNQGLFNNLYFLIAHSLEYHSNQTKWTAFLKKLIITIKKSFTRIHKWYIILSNILDNLSITFNTKEKRKNEWSIWYLNLNEA